MRVFIVSINHSHQIAPLRDEVDIPKLIKEKERLKNLVELAITHAGIDLICEESDPCRVSVVQDVAFKHTPRIPWKNINMTAQERLEAGIWEALLYRPQDINFDTGVTIDHRIAEDDVREKFFLTEILKAVEEYRSKNVLILCGDAHTEALKATLEALGHPIETNHELINEKNWK